MQSLLLLLQEVTLPTRRKVHKFKKKIGYLLLAVHRGPLAAQADARNVDLLVVSPGGVATTFMLEYLSRFARTNSPVDDDGLKHLPRPPRNAPRTIFIYGDLNIAFASLKRRNFEDHQGAKLGSVRCVLERGESQKRTFIRVAEAQYDRWRDWHGETLFIKYEEIWIV